MIPIHNILRRASFLLCLNGNRNSMLVRTADIEYVLTLHPEISHIDVSRNIYSGKVSDMYWTVGVWKRTGHKSPGEFFFTAHIIIIYYYSTLYTAKHIIKMRSDLI